MGLKVSKKKHIIWQTIIMSGVACFLSVYLSFFIRQLFDMSFVVSDIILAFVIPAIISPIIIYVILEQAYELYHSKKKIEELVHKDALTEIYNKRYFETFAEDIFLSRRKCSIILIDIDDFKNINDQYGHLAGDLVMKETAGIIKSQLRETDIVARIGGDEFAIICLDAEAEYGKEIAERIRKKVEQTELSYLSNNICLTISVGCVSNENDEISLNEFIQNADAALYTSKENGKNKVTFIGCA